MTKVTIRNGRYKLRGVPFNVNGLSFDLVEHFKVGSRGGYVTVDGRSRRGFPQHNIKIWCDSDQDYEMGDLEVNTNGDSSVDEPAEEVVPETDEEIMDRLRKRFEMLTNMTKAIKKGDVRAMIVSGPPGVGKSHGIEEVLSRYDSVDMLTGESSYQMVKGAVSPLGLYCKLYEMSSAGQVVVFDDCDSVFNDELSLNILKAALDSKERRIIHWNTDSNKLRDEGIPNSFEFKANAIFITNLKFNKVRGRMQEHIKALESRCHYMDLTIDSERDKLLRIRQVISDGMLESYDLDETLQEDILDFIDVNKNRLRELSLRTVLKVADLAKAFPNDWEAYAENTVMVR